jgi:hypothetical protein
MEKEFRVSWEIDTLAESPEEAVRQAVSYLEPREPSRWCYDVVDQETGEASRHEGEDVL